MAFGQSRAAVPAKGKGRKAAPKKKVAKRKVTKFNSKAAAAEETALFGPRPARSL